jgi:hypothetical protein
VDSVLPANPAAPSSASVVKVRAELAPAQATYREFE